MEICSRSTTSNYISRFILLQIELLEIDTDLFQLKEHHFIEQLLKNNEAILKKNKFLVIFIQEILLVFIQEILLVLHLYIILHKYLSSEQLEI